MRHRRRIWIYKAVSRRRKQEREHSQMTLTQWNKLEQLIAASHESLPVSSPNSSGGVRLNGQSLDLASVIAVSRYGAQVLLDEESLSRLINSAKKLEESLGAGKVIYGVNTGFGGSADTRNSQVNTLQETLVRELHYGILADPPTTAKPIPPKGNGHPNGQSNGDSLPSLASSLYERALPLGDPVAATCMPESWVRAAILIRINSLVSGQSGVRRVVVERMADLIKHGITPRIPLRGSISASGDLSPLSYVGGALQGKTTLTVWAGDPGTGIRRVITARQALVEHSLEPIKFEAKEGLAIVNGTAISCAVGALAIHEAQNLATLSQVLTAMSVEALQGSTESFDPLFAAVRPHPGQIESAQNIDHFLSGSQLVAVNDGAEEGSLRQDRYSIRTASQWLGPLLEDLSLAHQQVAIECNSVTDNPLIDDKGRMLHGGNFQAKSITSAMEKTRLALQSIGQMLFTQCTELTNPSTNRGLPSNLVADEPSESFIFKAVDLMSAALQSELGFLSNPAGTYVQPAEMGNQAINSLALISARYTQTAVDVLSQLAAGHLMALCQALDLRAMQSLFVRSFKDPFDASVSDTFGDSMDGADLSKLCETLWRQFNEQVSQTMTMHSETRFQTAIKTLQATILAEVPTEKCGIGRLKAWGERCTELALSSYRTTREAYITDPDATPLLGKASKRMYDFVRRELGIPFLLTSMLLDMESPQCPSEDAFSPESSDNFTGTGDTMGSLIGKIHGAIANGRLYAPVMACLQEVSRDA